MMTGVQTRPDPLLRSQTLELRWQASVGIACVCAMFGICAFLNTALWLLMVWRTDDLKSIGLVVPILSFALTLRAWRSIGWTTEGTWWGLCLLLAGAVMVFLRDQTMLVLTVHRSWLVQLPPVPLLAVLYAAGVVLLFGGVRLLRAAWFPVLLMAAVLPVPESFSRLVDLPLQHASATVARSFAHLLGEPLTADRLRLMFTPDFGMFIAPGCNGIRGAVTLGLAAVVLAHVYRFRVRLFVPVVLGAMLLGYVFNLLRLCLLVVYYKIALPYPWLQDRAKGADYLIGACLFVLALYLFFAVADRLRRQPDEVTTVQPSHIHTQTRPALPLLARAGALLVLALVFGLDDLHAQRDGAEQMGPIPAMPAALGPFQLQRTYQDTLATGVVVYTWGDYRLPGSGQTVSVGVSPVLGMHDVEVCHIARGEEPTWHGGLQAPTRGGEADFVAAMYNNGLLQTLEASTSCGSAGCRQFTDAEGQFTLVYAHPRRVVPMGTDDGRPVPMLLKVSSSDVGATPAAAEAVLAKELQAFLQDVDLGALAARFRPGARGTK